MKDQFKKMLCEDGEGGRGGAYSSNVSISGGTH